MDIDFNDGRSGFRSETSDPVNDPCQPHFRLLDDARQIHIRNTLNERDHSEALIWKRLNSFGIKRK